VQTSFFDNTRCTGNVLRAPCFHKVDGTQTLDHKNVRERYQFPASRISFRRQGQLEYLQYGGVRHAYQRCHGSDVKGELRNVASTDGGRFLGGAGATGVLYTNCKRATVRE
jgi:hypothetical protein